MLGMNPADRIAELEEQVRQMREAFAPTLALPFSWHFPPYERRVLFGLLAQRTFNAIHYRYACDPRGDGRDDQRNLSVVIWRVRKKLMKYAGAPMVQTLPRVGFYIEARDKLRLRLIIDAKLQSEASHANRTHHRRAVA